MGEMRLDPSYEWGCDAAAIGHHRKGGGWVDRSNSVSEIVKAPNIGESGFKYLPNVRGNAGCGPQGIPRGFGRLA